MEVVSTLAIQFLRADVTETAFSAWHSQITDKYVALFALKNIISGLSGLSRYGLQIDTDISRSLICLMW